MKSIYLCFFAAILLLGCDTNQTRYDLSSSIASVMDAPKAELKFGFNFNDFCVVSDQIEKNQVLSDILLPYQVSYQIIDELVKNTVDVFDTRKIRTGKNYHILCDRNSPSQAEYFIYENDIESFVVFELGDQVCAWEGQHDVTTKVREIGGVINSSLYQTLQDNDVSPALAMEMANMYAWSIDFYRINKGDYFKIIFEERFVNDQSVGVGEIICANFNHRGEDFYGFGYTQDQIRTFFDQEGNSLKKAFLKSPLKFSRISSKYSLNRRHPVTGKNKPHYGTDYAAPSGTPIMCVGDGVVIKSEYKRNNGNYVKVRHNDTYTTQYLHMSKRNVKVGEVVKQGDIIGFVGSTGLATGPHVCFRFWKNGRQVNHLKEDFIPADPIREENMSDYKSEIESMKIRLDEIQIEGVRKSQEVTLFADQK